MAPRTIAACLWLLAFSGPAWSQDNTVAFTLGASTSTFDYKETAANGATLNRENGQLVGLSAGLEIPLGQRFILGAGVFGYGGEVDYRGRTQAGTPLQTDTDERFINGRIWLSYIHRGSQLRYEPFLGLGYTQWDRSIQPRPPTLGLDERYSWLEPELGIRLRPQASGWAPLYAQLSVYWIQSGRVVVDLTEVGLGEPELDLGRKTGQRLSLGAVVNTWGKVSLDASVFFDHYAFGASDGVTLVSGSRTITLSEPQSDSYRRGVRLALRF